MVTINLICPESWQELTQEQLAFVYTLLAKGKTYNEIKTMCFFKWNNLKVIAHERHRYIVRSEKDTFPVYPMQLQAAIMHMQWVENVPEVPVRIENLGNHKAVPADFQGVSFESFLCAENMYQGYLYTKDETWLNELGCVLYDCDNRAFNSMERVNIFYWFTSLKRFFAGKFSNFFRPAGEDSGAAQPEESMNSQIRALTKGDITKERIVLEMDCWRALTELDAQAKEYEEMKAQYKN